MAKLMEFRVTVPGDDPVKAEAVKALLQAMVRDLGARVMAGEQVEGEILTEPPTAFFNAASVKTFVVREPRAAKAAKVKP